jgi:thiamine biosynthesis lipoprotein
VTRWSRRAFLLGSTLPVLARALPPKPRAGLPVLDHHATQVTALGTLFELQVAAAPGVNPTPALEASAKEIQRIHALISASDPDSDIARVNAAAGSASVEVSEETFALVRRCAEFSAASQGVFDITYATMSRLWVFDAAAPRLPDPSEVERLKPFVDYRRIILEEDRRAIMLPGAPMRLGLGGIARGYALDRVARLLVGAGFNVWRLTAGGIRLAGGRHPQGAWKVGLVDPRAVDKVFASLRVDEGAAATLGDHERFMVLGGKRYHPIIDPRTGYPARAVRSVTVVAPRAMDADWLTKACFILGPKESAPALATVAGAAAVWVTRNNAVEMGAALRKRVELLAPPTDGEP